MGAVATLLRADPSASARRVASPNAFGHRGQDLPRAGERLSPVRWCRRRPFRQEPERHELLLVEPGELARRGATPASAGSAKCCPRVLRARVRAVMPP